MIEHPELRKGRRRLFLPIKDNNAGKELSAATISRWICTTIVDSHAALQNSKSIPGKVQALKVSAVATSIQLFNKVDLKAVIKARRWSSRGTFTSFYIRDHCPQADRIHKTDPAVAAAEMVVISIICQILVLSDMLYELFELFVTELKFLIAEKGPLPCYS